MIEIDARGQNCPIPVIRTKKAIKELEENDVILTLVDNEIATQNLEKMAKELNLKIDIKKIDNDNFEVGIFKGEGEFPENTKQVEEINIKTNIVIVISSNQMGVGEEALGKTLMKSYLYALTEAEVLPKTIIFYNKGVTLTTEGSDSAEDIKTLEEKGVEVLSCGACLNYYNLAEKLLVGGSTNMYEISNKMLEASKVIRP